MTAKSGASLLMLVIVLDCLDIQQVSSPPTPPPPGVIVAPQGVAERPSISAALHLHGWSNHSAPSRPASIAWHTQQHAAAGVELIWWTDHSDIYHSRVADFVVTPSTPTVLAPSLWSLGTWGPGGYGQAFLRLSGGRSATVVAEPGRVTVSLPPAPSGGATDTVELYFGRLVNDRPQKASYPVLARALVGDPHLQFTLWPSALSGRYVTTDILVPLAWHPNGAGGFRQVLRYRFEEGADSSVDVRGDTLLVTRGWPAGDSASVQLRPLPDASLLPDGMDNTTDEYRIRFLLPRDGTSQSVAFSFPVISDSVSTAASQMPPAVQLAHAEAQSYGIRAMWGIEAGPETAEIGVSRWEAVAGAGRHLLPYLPMDITPSLVDSLPGSASKFTAFIRSHGGVTSIAHPFGTGGGFPTSSRDENEALVLDLGSFLFRYQAWGADLIEVGYRAFGGVGLYEHLRLLDALTASGLRICGVGTSDSHGDRLLADPASGTQEQFNFVSWIGGVDRVAPGAELIAGLRRCEVSFGNPFYVRGGFWITVQPDSAGNPSLTIDARGVSPSAQLYLYEGEIDSSGVFHAPVYRQAAVVLNRDAHPHVGGCRPGFARLEAWFGDLGLAFSNVVRIPAEPLKCPAAVSPSR